MIGDDDDENYFEVTETHKGKASRITSDFTRERLSDVQTERWSNELKSRSEKWLSKSKKIHGDRYDYSKVEFVNVTTKVTIICKKHGEFEQVASFHARGAGCRKCNIDSKKLTTEEILSRFKSMHGDRYDYSKVEYVDYSTPVTIICPIHGEFEQIYYSHSKGTGCLKCGYKITSKHSQEKVIAKFKEVHGDKYDYSKVEYVNSHTKVIIICKEHGEFLQKPYLHKQGNGCPKCWRKSSK